MRKSKLFLFDKPLSNLDAALRAQTRIEIDNLHRELSATMVYVTQDQVEAMTLADRIVVLRDGRIEQVGAPMELYSIPANEFVVGFIGSPKMNFLNAFALGAPGKSVGVRPEHITLSDSGEGIDGRVSHVRHPGGETQVYINADPHGLVAVRLFGEHAYSVNDRLVMRPDMAHAFYFDDNGQRLHPIPA